MKNIFFSVICICLICLILLSGCKSEVSTAAPIVSGIEFTAEITRNGNKAVFDITVNQNGNTEACSLSGVSYLFTPTSVTVKCDGLEYKTEASNLPEYTFTDFIYSVFLTVAKEKPKAYSDENGCYVSGENEKYRFKLYFGGSGLPLGIEDTDNRISVIIKSPTILSGNS